MKSSVFQVKQHLRTTTQIRLTPQTTIAFSLPEAAQVQLVIYDMLGRQVQTLVDGALSSGRHEVRFEAADLPSGSYLYRLVTPTQTFVKQMMLVK